MAGGKQLFSGIIKLYGHKVEIADFSLELCVHSTTNSPGSGIGLEQFCKKYDFLVKCSKKLWEICTSAIIVYIRKWPQILGQS